MPSLWPPLPLSPLLLLLRLFLQRGVISIPKSTSPARIAENAATLGSGWVLTAEELEALDGLDDPSTYGSAASWTQAHQLELWENVK